MITHLRMWDYLLATHELSRLGGVCQWIVWCACSIPVQLTVMNAEKE